MCVVPQIKDGAQVSPIDPGTVQQPGVGGAQVAVPEVEEVPPLVEPEVLEIPKYIVQFPTWES